MEPGKSLIKERHKGLTGNKWDANKWLIVPSGPPETLPATQLKQRCRVGKRRWTQFKRIAPTLPPTEHMDITAILSGMGMGLGKPRKSS